MFVELVPLLKDRTLLLTIARVDGKVKVNVLPVKAKKGEDQDWLSQIRPQPWMYGRRLDDETLTTKNQQSRKCSSGHAGNDSVLAAR